MNNRQRSDLEKIFGARISLDPLERKLYGHDIAALPGLFKPLVGNTTPQAVVQPQSEEELSLLMRWAQASGTPLTPRGKATSGYGGVLPVKQGLVVDFHRMNKVVRIDPENQTATVQAGVVWEKLDRELEKRDLTLRLYPTSYPSSTVGGWLAQGGAGIGSYKFGCFRNNVERVRAVLPSGESREFSGSDIDLISEAEGITGFITEVTLRIQPLEELDVLAFGCPSAHELQQFAQCLVEQRLPIWSFLFINPRMAELKNKAPLMEHAGHKVEERVLLPAAYVSLLAFRREDKDEVLGRLPQMLKPCEAEILSDRIAQHEWRNRYKLMVVKRLGPSLVPAEVVIPLSALGKVMTEIERKVDQPIVKEGVILRQGFSGEPEVVILGFIPSDQRKFSYNFVFSLALTIMKIAEENGGRPYSTGLYFASRAKRVLGEARAKRLKAYKAEVDPQNLLNPKKVLGSGAIGAAIALGAGIEPLMRPLGNYIITKIGERPVEPIRGIPADVAWYAYSCSQCGYCVDECDQFYGRGWESQSPRGKWYWLREFLEGRENWNQSVVDTMLVCTTCEMCDRRCSASLPIEPSWMKLRGLLIQDNGNMTLPPFEMMSEALQTQGNIWAGYRKDRDAWFPEDLVEKHGPHRSAPVAYFAGCTASYVEKDIALATVRLLDAAGVDFAYLGNKESCCGTPMLVAGKWEIFAQTMKKNIRAVKEAGASTVVSSCPACDMMWRQVYPSWAKKLGLEYDIVPKHYSELVSERIRSGTFDFPQNENPEAKVTWHDSCHIGRASGVYDPPRDIIKAIPNSRFVEMPYTRENAHCCGSVLTLLKSPDVAAEIGKIRLDEAVEVGAEKILALCPCCQFQLRVSAEKKNIPVEIVDLAHFAASALGYKFPDPNPEVQRQWAVFEAMISLMTPAGFAALMDTMWPEVIDAMPFGMGRMMRWMGRVPGALLSMKPMFPVLFPKLLPMMMPKLMPTMLARVAERIPMPDYMKEQMPNLMPKVVDNLMPHMIADLVPLVTEPMIGYLTGRSNN